MPALKRNATQKPFLVLVTAPTRQEAERLSDCLLKKNLAACINVIYPVTSFFRWKGKREKAREALLVIKTLSSRFRELEALIRKYHTYDVPEIIGYSIEKGSVPYLEWLRESVSPR